MTEFRSKLLGSESSGDYGVVQGDYSGGYQFGPARFSEFEDFLGRDVSRDEFLRSPALQEQAMDWHERDILDYVEEFGLDDYVGKTVGGVEVTPSSLLAMAHLGGRKGMRRFLESGGEDNPVDKFGTSLSDYGSRFSGLEYLPYGDEETVDLVNAGIMPGLDRKKRGALSQAMGLLAPSREAPPELLDIQLRRGTSVDPLRNFQGVGSLGGEL